VRGLELVARMRAGDGAALEVAFRQFGPELMVYATRCLGSKDAASDVVQEVFVTLWKLRERLDVHESLRLYLFRAARNRVLNVERNARARERLASAIGGQLESGAPSVIAHLAEQEYAAVLAAAVAELPPRPREIFTMSRQRGMSYEQIASALGLSQKTIEGHMARALRDVRAKLRRHLDP
jgi:RNA polymerase sigma-70 factor (ECF subfamily)